jgi:biopolymer transport protein ExbD
MKIGTPRTPRADSEQSIMPLINIVFLLLIFFMVAGQLTQSDPVPLDPPVSRSEAEVDLHPGRFLVDKTGRIFHLGEEVAKDSLAQLAVSLSADHEELLVKADLASPTGEVLKVISTLRAAGAGKVRLLTVGAAE